MGDPLDLPVGRGGQLLEGARLGLAAQPPGTGRDGDDAPPALRDRETGQQRGDLLAPKPPPSLHDEPAEREGPGADSRALAPGDRAGQLDRVGR